MANMTGNSRYGIAGARTPCDIQLAVDAFNARFAEMEKALWCLSRAAANDVLARRSSGVVEEFVWLIKRWWGIQGVPREIRTIAASALRALDWDPRWITSEMDLSPQGEQFAVDRVAGLVAGMLQRGARRREWSLASKVLHWLMPWRIPVYDSFVKRQLGISQDADPEKAYRAIVRAEFEMARQLLREDDRWLGDVEPRSPFRALDKYIWWSGGGNTGHAVVARDPWETLRRLGLKCYDGDRLSESGFNVSAIASL